MAVCIQLSRAGGSDHKQCSAALLGCVPKPTYYQQVPPAAPPSLLAPPTPVSPIRPQPTHPQDLPRRRHRSGGERGKSDGLYSAPWRTHRAVCLA